MKNRVILANIKTNLMYIIIIYKIAYVKSYCILHILSILIKDIQKWNRRLIIGVSLLLTLNI